jgi:hypothetical protein
VDQKRFQGNHARTGTILVPILLVVLLATGCSGLIGLARNAKDVKRIKPSGVVVTETRDVSGFTALDIRTLGKVILTQADSESLTISGSDNVVPLIVTRVSDGTLIIEMQQGIVLTNMSSDNMLTFEITVRDLSGLTISGLASVEMDTLTTTALSVSMSGGGNLKLGELSADSVDITVSGLGGVEIAGQVARQGVVISGAGEVKNADLKCETADANIPGLGTATIWVTDRLTGEISGGGSVRYYGTPETDTKSTGLGKFEALGNK